MCESGWTPRAQQIQIAQVFCVRLMQQTPPTPETISQVTENVTHPYEYLEV